MLLGSPGSASQSDRNIYSKTQNPEGIDAENRALKEEVYRYKTLSDDLKQELDNVKRTLDTQNRHINLRTLRLYYPFIIIPLFLLEISHSLESKPRVLPKELSSAPEPLKEYILDLLTEIQEDQKIITWNFSQISSMNEVINRYKKLCKNLEDKLHSELENWAKEAQMNAIATYPSKNPHVSYEEHILMLQTCNEINIGLLNSAYQQIEFLKSNYFSFNDNYVLCTPEEKAVLLKHRKEHLNKTMDQKTQNIPANVSHMVKSHFKNLSLEMSVFYEQVAALFESPMNYPDLVLGYKTEDPVSNYLKESLALTKTTQEDSLKAMNRFLTELKAQVDRNEFAVDKDFLRLNEELRAKSNEILALNRSCFKLMILADRERVLRENLEERFKDSATRMAELSSNNRTLATQLNETRTKLINLQRDETLAELISDQGAWRSVKEQLITNYLEENKALKTEIASLKQQLSAKTNELKLAKSVSEIRKKKCKNLRVHYDNQKVELNTCYSIIKSFQEAESISKDRIRELELKISVGNQSLQQQRVGIESDMIHALDNENKTLRNELGSLRGEFSSRTRAVEDLRMKMFKKKEKIDGFRGELQRKILKIHELEFDLTKAHNRIKELLGTCLSFERREHELQRLCRGLANQDQVSNAIQASVNYIGELEEENSRLRMENESMQDVIEQTKHEMMRKESSLKKLTAENLTLLNKNKELKARVQAAEETTAKLEEKYEKCATALMNQDEALKTYCKVIGAGVEVQVGQVQYSIESILQRFFSSMELYQSEISTLRKSKEHALVALSREELLRVLLCSKVKQCQGELEEARIQQTLLEDRLKNAKNNELAYLMSQKYYENEVQFTQKILKLVSQRGDQKADGSQISEILRNVEDSFKRGQELAKGLYGTIGELQSKLEHQEHLQRESEILEVKYHHEKKMLNSQLKALFSQYASVSIQELMNEEKYTLLRGEYLEMFKDQLMVLKPEYQDVKQFVNAQKETFEYELKVRNREKMRLLETLEKLKQKQAEAPKDGELVRILKRQAIELTEANAQLLRELENRRREIAQLKKTKDLDDGKKGEKGYFEELKAIEEDFAQRREDLELKAQIRLQESRNSALNDEIAVLRRAIVELEDKNRDLERKISIVTAKREPNTNDVSASLERVIEQLKEELLEARKIRYEQEEEISLLREKALSVSIIRSANEKMLSSAQHELARVKSELKALKTVNLGSFKKIQLLENELETLKEARVSALL